MTRGASGGRPAPLKACEPKHRLLRSRRGPMLSPSYSISPKDLWNLIATPTAPLIVDVRRRDAYAQSPHLLPARALARRRTRPRNGRANSTARGRSSVACKAGHEMSQMDGRAIARRRLRRARAGRRLRGLGDSRIAVRRQSRARPHRAEAAEPVGDAAAAEARPRRLPLADPPLPRSASAHPVRRSRPRCRMSRAKAAPCRSTSRTSN